MPRNPNSPSSHVNSLPAFATDGPFVRLSDQFAMSAKIAYHPMQELTDEFALLGAVHRGPFVEVTIWQFVPMGVHGHNSGSLPTWDDRTHEFGEFARKWTWLLQCAGEVAQKRFTGKGVFVGVGRTTVPSRKGDTRIFQERPPTQRDKHSGKSPCRAHEFRNHSARRGPPNFEGTANQLQHARVRYATYLGHARDSPIGPERGSSTEFSLLDDGGEFVNDG
jgi:hypothetical protein